MLPVRCPVCLLSRAAARHAPASDAAGVPGMPLPRRRGGPRPRWHPCRGWRRHHRPVRSPDLRLHPGPVLPVTGTARPGLGPAPGITWRIGAATTLTSMSENNAELEMSSALRLAKVIDPELRRPITELKYGQERHGVAAAPPRRRLPDHLGMSKKTEITERVTAGGRRPGHRAVTVSWT